MMVGLPIGMSEDELSFLFCVPNSLLSEVEQQQTTTISVLIYTLKLKQHG